MIEAATQEDTIATNAGETATMRPRKGSITIYVNDDGSHYADPQIGLLDRNVQIMQWSVVNLFTPTTYEFQFRLIDPIVINGWPGQPPVRENDYQVRANVNKRVNVAEQYSYTYFLEKVPYPPQEDRKVLDVIRKDPDMENQPEP
jgi:hypothetical protein